MGHSFATYIKDGFAFYAGSYRYYYNYWDSGSKYQDYFHHYYRQTDFHQLGEYFDFSMSNNQLRGYGETTSSKSGADGGTSGVVDINFLNSFVVLVAAGHNQSFIITQSNVYISGYTSVDGY